MMSSWKEIQFINEVPNYLGSFLIKKMHEYQRQQDLTI